MNWNDCRQIGNGALSGTGYAPRPGNLERGRIVERVSRTFECGRNTESGAGRGMYPVQSGTGYAKAGRGIHPVPNVWNTAGLLGRDYCHDRAKPEKRNGRDEYPVRHQIKSY